MRFKLHVGVHQGWLRTRVRMDALLAGVGCVLVPATLVALMASILLRDYYAPGPSVGVDVVLYHSPGGFRA